MKSAWIAAAGLLALAAPAFSFADTAPKPAAAAVTTQGPVDPERLKLARELIGVLDMKSVTHNMIKGMQNGIRLPPEATPQQREKLDRLFSSLAAGMDANGPEMLDQIAQLYARNLTTKELRDSLAFYHTPSGQALLAKLPALSAQIGPITLAMMPKVVASAKATYCKTGCDATDEAMFSNLDRAYGGQSR